MLQSSRSLPNPRIPPIILPSSPIQSDLPTATQSSRHRLHDVLYPFRDLLVAQGSFGSLATLVRCNRDFCEIFKPALAGRRIVLRGAAEPREIFRDIIGVYKPDVLELRANKRKRSSSLPNRVSSKISRASRNRKALARAYDHARNTMAVSGESVIEPWEIGFGPQRKSTRLHHARIRSLGACEVLTILDFEAAEVFREAAIAVGEDERVFRNIPSLCLGSDLLKHLAEGSDHTKDILNQLKDRLSPRHVCFTLHIPPKQKTMDRLERIGCLPSATQSASPWETHYLHSTSRVIQTLCESWAPGSITIHGMTAENIPAVYSGKTTLFFGPEPDVEAGCDEIYWRADVRCSEIANGVAILDTEHESAIFVGTERFFGREGLREDELGVISVADRVWREIGQESLREEIKKKVRFEGREEAEKCVCCGKK